MQLTFLKSKIHRAIVTGASLDYEGSLTISADLAELVGLVPYEKILVGNLSNGERFETYAIYGEVHRRIIELTPDNPEAYSDLGVVTIYGVVTQTLADSPQLVLRDTQNDNRTIRVYALEDLPVRTRTGTYSTATQLRSHAVFGTAPVMKKTCRIVRVSIAPVPLSRIRTHSRCVSPSRPTISAPVLTTIVPLSWIRRIR